jgi:hypothetical protein
MRTQYLMALSLLGGIAIGGFAVQGLSAQTKLKAYSIGEIEPIAGATVSPAYIAAARKALADAGGRSMGTLKGRVFHAEGGSPPISVPMSAEPSSNGADREIAGQPKRAWNEASVEAVNAIAYATRYHSEARRT